MKEPKVKITTIDQYIYTFPVDVQLKLQELREIIAKAAPHATEKLAYDMPTFYQNGNLVHFAAWKNHIGFYGTPSDAQKFAEDHLHLKTSKGTIQFPYDKPFPIVLIVDVVKARIEACMSK